MDPMETFDYVQLAEIDPAQQTLPTDFYTLKVLKLVKKEGISQKNNNPYQRIDIAVAVTNHPEFSGRRLYDSFFPSDFSKKVLRRIMDATGIVQEPGQQLDAWLEAITTAQPELRTQVKQVEDRDRDGNIRSYNYKNECALVNKINWFEIAPA